MLPAGRRPHSGPGKIIVAQLFQPVKGFFPAWEKPLNRGRRMIPAARQGRSDAPGMEEARGPEGPPPPAGRGQGRGPPGGCRSRADGRGPRAIAKAHDGAAAGAAMGETRTGPAEAAARARTPEAAACAAQPKGEGSRGGHGAPHTEEARTDGTGNGDGWGPRGKRAVPRGERPERPRGPDPGPAAAAPQGAGPQPRRASAASRDGAAGPGPPEGRALYLIRGRYSIS